MASANIHMRDVMSNVTMTVTIRGVRGHRVRFWIGSRLVALAAYVLGCRVEILGAAVDGGLHHHCERHKYWSNSKPCPFCDGAR